MNLGHDTTYAQQRLLRMQDAIDDYLGDSDVTARQTYEEMLSCIQDVEKYHKDMYDKAVQLRGLMMGYRGDPELLSQGTVDKELAMKWSIPERY